MIVLFISLAVLLVLIVAFIIFYPKIKRNKFRKDFVSIYGKKIYRYALHNDLYLLNELALKGNDDQTLNIDHLLFGTKYIYVISDYYLPGTIEAKENDRSFVYKPHQKNSKPTYINNLLIKGATLTKKVALNLGLNPSLFIPIALVDNEADFLGFKPKAENNFIIHYANLHKLLNALEARNIAPLNDDQLKYAVKDVNRLNERKKGRQSK